MRYKLLILLLNLSYFTVGQELARRADLGASIGFPNGKDAGATVRNVDPGSPLDKSGLRPGDVIIKLNQEVIKDPDRWSDIFFDLRADDQLELLVKRQDQFLSINAQLRGLPKETYKNTRVLYEMVTTNNGLNIRTIITHPKNMKGKLPALFVVGGLSCSSIEVYPGRRVSGWTQVLQDLVTKSGMVVMRMEKPGVGDSNGNCGQSNFEEDILAFITALKDLKSKNYVDSSKVIIYGSSMGSALAPYLANKVGVAGVISDGTFVKTWFEHMLEIERRILEFKGNSPSEIMEKMNEGYIPLYYGMLVEKKSYAQVVAEKPWLEEYNYHSPNHMYGRPVKYYHQVQDFNFSKNWYELKVPVRIIRGTNDWIMSDDDNDMIIAILDKNGHQDHLLYRYPGLDHWNMIHEQPIDSFQGKTGKWDDNISQIIIDFAQEMVQ